MRRNSPTNIFSALCATLLLLSAASVQAVTVDSAWLNPVSGDWTDGTKWSTSPVYPNNGSPGAGDAYDVVIGAAGAPYVITLGGDISTNRITINSPSANLFHTSGQLTADEINIAQGKLTLGSNIVGARIFGNGILEVVSGDAQTPEFHGVTLGMDMVVPSSGGSARAKLVLRDGLHMDGGITIALEQRGARVDVVGSQSLTGVGEIVFGSTNSTFQFGSLRLAENSVLTIGPEIAIRTTTMAGSIGGAGGISQAQPNVGVVNYGLLSGEADNRPLEVMNVEPRYGATFHNFGTVQAIGNGLTIVGGDWINHGVFRIRDNGKLFLNGEFSPEDIGVIDRQGGDLYIAGTVLNAGKTLRADASTGDIILGRYNISTPTPIQVSGGVIDAADGTKWHVHDAVFDNVTLSATAELENNRVLRVRHDLNLDGGLISLTGTTAGLGGADVIFDDAVPQAIRGDGTIQVFGGSTNQIRGGQHLTIENGVTIHAAKGSVDLDGNRITNEGRISVDAGARLRVSPAEFLNRGTMETAGVLEIYGSQTTTASWQNEGTIHIKPGGTLRLAGDITLGSFGTIVDEGAERIDFSGNLDLEGNVLDLEDLNFTVPLRLVSGTIRNGVITSSGDARLQVPPGGFGSTLDGILLQTNLRLDGGVGATVYVENDLVLENATVTVPAGARFGFRGPQTLSGTGTIFAPQEPGTAAITYLGGEELTIGEGIVIRDGTVNQREVRLSFLENRGHIISEGVGTLFTIGQNISPAAEPQCTNNGVIEARDGRLELWGNYTVDHLGELVANGGMVALMGQLQNEGRTIHLNSETGGWSFRGTVHGGRLESIDGAIADLGGTFRNVTFSGEGRVAKGTSVQDSHLRVVHGLTLDDGVITVPAEVRLGFIEGQASLAGRGEILLNGPTTTTSIGTSVAPHMTIGEQIVIRTGPTGGGTVGYGERPTINHGIISAETPGRELAIIGGLTNHGLLQNKNQSDLVIKTTSWTNDGTILAIGPFRNDGFVVIEATQFANSETGLIGGTGRLVIPNTTLVNHGTIAPGLSIGNLTIGGNVALADRSVLDFELGPGGLADRLTVQGSLQLGGVLELSALPGFGLNNLNPITVLSTSGGIVNGRFANDQPIRLGGYDFAIHYGITSVWLTPMVAEVPEPASFCGLAAVCLAAVVLRRRWW